MKPQEALSRARKLLADLKAAYDGLSLEHQHAVWIAVQDRSAIAEFMEDTDV